MEIETDNKKHIIAAVEAQLVNAEDNLIRANFAFSKFNYEQMNQLHGQSGKTRREILGELKNKLAKWGKVLSALKI